LIVERRNRFYDSIPALFWYVDNFDLITVTAVYEKLFVGVLLNLF